MAKSCFKKDKNKENNNLNLSQRFKTLKVLIGVCSQFEILGYLVAYRICLWYITMQSINGVFWGFLCFGAYF